MTTESSAIKLFLRRLRRSGGCYPCGLVLVFVSHRPCLPAFLRLCHPERGRSSGGEKDLTLNRRGASAKRHHRALHLLARLASFASIKLIFIHVRLRRLRPP